MTPRPAEDVLRELSERATPGPWVYEPGGGHAYNRIAGSDVVQIRGQLDRPGASYTERVAEHFGDTELPGPAANVALICTTRNATPAIADLIAAARAKASRGHEEDCCAVARDGDCCCGHDDLQSALAAVDEKIGGGR